MNKNGKRWTFSQPPLFRKGTQAGDTRLPIRNKAELETGSHLQQKGRQDNDALCFHSVYQLYLRPNTVPGRWGTVGAPRDFIPGGLLQPRGQVAPPPRPCAQFQDRPTDRRGARAPRKGTCCETLEHFPLPSLPS